MIIFFISSLFAHENTLQPTIDEIKQLLLDKEYNMSINVIQNLLSKNNDANIINQLNYLLAEAYNSICDYQQAIKYYIEVYLMNGEQKLQSLSKAKRICLLRCDISCSQMLKQYVNNQYLQRVNSLWQAKNDAIKSQNVEAILNVYKNCQQDKQMNIMLIQILINSLQLDLAQKLIEKDKIILGLSEKSQKHLSQLFNLISEMLVFQPQKVIQYIFDYDKKETLDSIYHITFNSNTIKRQKLIQTKYNQAQRLLNYYNIIHQYIQQTPFQIAQKQNKNPQKQKQINTPIQNQSELYVSQEINLCTLYQQFEVPTHEIKIIFQQIGMHIQINRRRLIQELHNQYMKLSNILQQQCKLRHGGYQYTKKIYTNYKNKYNNLIAHQKQCQNSTHDNIILDALEDTLWYYSCFQYLLYPLKQVINQLYQLNQTQISIDINETENILHYIRCKFIALQHEKSDMYQLLDINNRIKEISSLLEIILAVKIALIQPNFNQILGVNENSTIEQIQQNYELRIKALQQSASIKKLQERVNIQRHFITEAYNVLTIEAKRQLYNTGRYREEDIIQLIKKHNDDLDQCQ